MSASTLRRCFLFVSAVLMAFSPACTKRKTRTVEVQVPVEPTGALVAILVTPFQGVMIKGTTLPFQATGVFDDATTKDLTDNVAWSSSSDEVASVSNDEGFRGRVAGNAAGEATITATLDAVSGFTDLTVVEAALVLIQVTPCHASIEVGASIEFSATGIFQNGITQDISDLVSWSSTDEEIASIENEGEGRGFAEGLNPGKVDITAALDDTSGSTSLRVTQASLVAILLDPTHDVLVEGSSVQFHATGFFDNGVLRDITGEVNWTSDDIYVASPDAEVAGLVHAFTPGMASITASLGEASASAWVTVTAARLISITVAPENPSAPAGTFEVFRATGEFENGSTRDITEVVLWSSSDHAVAQVSNVAGEKGEAAALSPGKTTITATLAGVTGSTELTVTGAKLVAIRVLPADPVVGTQSTLQFQAIGDYDDESSQDITGQVVWSSSQELVAVVENAEETKGRAITGLTPGETTISATKGAVSGSTVLTVAPGMPSLICVRVTPSLANSFPGQARQFAATGFFSDGTVADLTEAASWKSEDPQVADVSDEPGQKGLATAAAPGTARIVAAVGEHGDEAWLVVTAPELIAIKIDPPEATVEAGGTLQLKAIGIFEDDSQADITAAASWTSTDPKVASVGDTAADKGVVTGLDGGTIEVQASLDGITGAASLEVTDARLLALIVSPGNPTILKGRTIQFTAMGILSNGNFIDVTAKAAWDSSVPLVASVSNEPGLKGLAKGLSDGKSTIRATLDGIEGETKLNVENKIFAIVVSPPDFELPVGATQQYTAVCYFTDGSFEDITNHPDLVWESSKPEVGDFDPDVNGFLIAKTPGKVERISATIHELVGTTTATVIEITEQP